MNTLDVFRRVCVLRKAWDKAWNYANSYEGKPIISSMEGDYDRTVVCWCGDPLDTVYTDPFQFHIELLQCIAAYEENQ